MKIAITGGTGFVGKNLIERFQAEGVEFVSIQRSAPAGANEFRCWVYDGEFDNLKDFFAAEKFDGVIHLASHFVAEHTFTDVPKLIRSNIEFPTYVLEAAVASGSRWFLNTGTFWQHFENADYEPVNLYAASKQAFEDIGRYYESTKRIRFCTLKISDTFGPGDPRNKLAKALKASLSNSSPFQMSEGEQHLSILFIEDVIDGFLKLARALDNEDGCIRSKKCFALAPAQTVSLKEFVRLFSEVAGKPILVNWGARPYREREVMQPWSNYEILPEWRPRYSLQEGIAKYLLSND